MKQKKIATHKIGLVGQAPSRRGDPRKPLAGPNGQKIARLAGISYDELIACRRKHLNTHSSGKRGKGDAFDHAKGSVNAADVLMDWRVERIVLLGKNVARCFGFRDLPFLAEIRIYGRRFLIFLLAPIGGGTNDETNDALGNFCSGSYGARRFPLDSERVDRRGVRACPQTDRIFNTDRPVLFLRRLAYQDQPHSSTHAGFVDDIMAASLAVRRSITILARQYAAHRSTAVLTCGGRQRQKFGRTGGAFTAAADFA